MGRPHSLTGRCAVLTSFPTAMIITRHSLWSRTFWFHEIMEQNQQTLLRRCWTYSFGPICTTFRPLAINSNFRKGTSTPTQGRVVRTKFTLLGETTQKKKNGQSIWKIGFQYNEYQTTKDNGSSEKGNKKDEPDTCTSFLLGCPGCSRMSGDSGRGGNTSWVEETKRRVWKGQGMRSLRTQSCHIKYRIPTYT